MSGGPVLVALALTSTGTEVLLDRVLSGRTCMPSLALVQTWAAENIGLVALDEVQSWPTRARLRGLVPRVGARLGSDANVYVRDTLGDFATTTADRRALALRVEARFDFGDLVFADLELRANREAIARSAAERLVLEEVTRIYFERLELWISSLLAPTPQKLIRLAGLDGLLRAQTGGRYALCHSEENRP